MKKRRHFVICIKADGADDLVVRKLYRILSDKSALARGHFRVIDESGEAYLYPAEWFVPVEVSDEAGQVLALLSPDATVTAH
jgi:hypothetical protein